MRKLELFQSQRGSILVTVLSLTVIMLVGILSLSMITTSMQRENKTMQQKLEVRQFEDFLNVHWGDQANCNCSFLRAAPNLPYAFTTPPSEIRPALECGGGPTLDSTFSVPGTTTDTKISKVSLLTVGPSASTPGFYEGELEVQMMSGLNLRPPKPFRVQKIFRVNPALEITGCVSSGMEKLIQFCNKISGGRYTPPPPGTTGIGTCTLPGAPAGGGAGGGPPAIAPGTSCGPNNVGFVMYYKPNTTLRACCFIFQPMFMGGPGGQIPNYRCREY